MYNQGQMLHYYHPRDKRMHNYALTNKLIIYS